MPRGVRQAIQISREAFCWAPGATELALMASNVTLKMFADADLFVAGI